MSHVLYDKCHYFFKPRILYNQKKKRRGTRMEIGKIIKITVVEPEYIPIQLPVPAPAPEPEPIIVEPAPVEPEPAYPHPAPQEVRG